MPEENQEQGDENFIIPQFIYANQIEERDTPWLWSNMIPGGCITLLSGDPGIGKSYVLAQIAAHLLGIRPFPNLFPAFSIPQILLGGRGLWFNAEDSLEQTIIPRLLRAGIPRGPEGLERIFFDDGWHNRDGERGYSSLSDPDLFRKQLALAKPTFVIIDTLDAYMGDANNNQATTIRSIMTPISKMAEEFGVAILAVRHLSKGAQEKALYRGAGSIALTALARSELFFGFDPDDDNKDLDARKRVIAQVKCSVGQRSPSIAYRILPDEADPRHARFMWDGLNENSAEELVAPGHKESDEERSAIDEASDFLSVTLASGPVDSNEIKRLAKENYIGWRTVERAKKRMRVKSRKTLDDYGKAKWMWSQNTDEGKGGEG